MIYRLTYHFDGAPFTVRYEADDLDMAVAQANLEHAFTKRYPLLEAAVDVEGYGDDFQLVRL